MSGAFSTVARGREPTFFTWPYTRNFKKFLHIVLKTDPNNSHEVPFYALCLLFLQILPLSSLQEIARRGENFKKVLNEFFSQLALVCHLIVKKPTKF